MTKMGQDKLNDYLGGFSGLSYDGITPIGAIITGPKDHGAVLGELKNNGFTEISDNDLELKLAGISGKLASGEKLFVNLSSEIPVKVFNFFLDITRGKILGAKVLFVMPAKLYDSYARFDRLITSICRL